jgi:hypothetical protein
VVKEELQWNWKVGGNFLRKTAMRAEKKIVRYGKGKNAMK